MLHLLEAVADSRPLLLPWNMEDSIQMVDESELWELFTRMRRVLWDIPHAKHSIDYHRIVQEFPPLGSRFDAQGGYFTPGNICITRSRRMEVLHLKNTYSMEWKEQKDQANKARIYVTEQRLPVIPDNYGEEPLHERKRPMTLQDRPPTPHVQAGTSAVLQRDPRMTCGYTVAGTGMQNIRVGYTASRQGSSDGPYRASQRSPSIPPASTQ